MSLPWRIPGYSQQPSKPKPKPTAETACHQPTKKEDETFESCMRFLNLAKENDLPCFPCDKLHPLYVKYLRCQKYTVTRKPDYDNVCLPHSER